MAVTNYVMAGDGALSVAFTSEHGTYHVFGLASVQLTYEFVRLAGGDCDFHEHVARIAPDGSLALAKPRPQDPRWWHDLCRQAGETAPAARRAFTRATIGCATGVVEVIVAAGNEENPELTIGEEVVADGRETPLEVTVGGLRDPSARAGLVDYDPHRGYWGVRGATYSDVLVLPGAHKGAEPAEGNKSGSRDHD